MTVPVTGESRSVDEETLHEFHLGFFSFIFTCNFIPVYVSSLPSSPCPLSYASPSHTPLPSPALSPFPFSLPLLPSPPFPGDLEGEPWMSLLQHTHQLSHTSNAYMYETHQGFMFLLRSHCFIMFYYVHRCLSLTANTQPTHLKRKPPPGFDPFYTEVELGLGISQQWLLPRGLEAESHHIPVPGHRQQGQQGLCTAGSMVSPS